MAGLLGQRELPPEQQSYLVISMRGRSLGDDGSLAQNVQRNNEELPALMKVLEYTADGGPLPFVVGEALAGFFRG